MERFPDPTCDDLMGRGLVGCAAGDTSNFSPASANVCSPASEKSSRAVLRFLAGMATSGIPASRTLEAFSLFSPFFLLHWNCHSGKPLEGISSTLHLEFLAHQLHLP